MKIVFVLQVFMIMILSKAASAIFGFGDPPEDSQRIRIYLEDDEKLLVPKDSKVEYISPEISETSEEMYFENGPTFPTYITKAAKKPSYPQSLYPNSAAVGLTDKPYFTLEDLKIKSAPVESHFGGYLGGYAPPYRNPKVSRYGLPHSQVNKQSPVVYGKLLRPILLLPNGWIKGANIQENEHVKPVTEYLEDDLKYDFRTKTHSLR